MEIILRCKSCDYEMETERYDPLTGCDYGAGFIFTCPNCRGDLEDVRPAEPEPTCECHKVLMEINYKRSKLC
jgi:hypothetical protein